MTAVRKTMTSIDPVSPSARMMTMGSHGHHDPQEGAERAHGLIALGELTGENQNNGQLGELGGLNGIAPDDVQPGLHALSPVGDRNHRQQHHHAPVNQAAAAVKKVVGNGHQHADDQGRHQHEEALAHRIGGFDHVVQEGNVRTGIRRIGRDTDGHDPHQGHHGHQRYFIRPRVQHVSQPRSSPAGQSIKDIFAGLQEGQNLFQLLRLQIPDPGKLGRREQIQIRQIGPEQRACGRPHFPLATSTRSNTI